jgi:DNA-binding CsgD family transcriptional regulator
LLGLASVFTAGFEFAELQSLSQLDEGLLLECLEQALAEELVRPLGGERYDFAHALVREALYERLSPSRRVRLHRRLAETLERLREQDPAQVAGELVRQYHASATLPGAERGATHALTAGRQARRIRAPGDAVIMLRLGLDLVSARDAETREWLLGELALAEAEAGLFDDAPRTLEAAVSLLEEGGAPGERIAELVYEVGAAFNLTVLPQGLQAIEPLIGRALAAVGKTRGLAWARLKLLHRFAGSEATGAVRVLHPIRLDPDAVRLARSEGSEADYAFSLSAWDSSFGPEVEQLIARVDGWRDPLARLRALHVVVTYVTLFESGCSPAAERLCAELVALADEVGLAPRRTLARVFHAALLGGRGEFDAAAEQIQQARAVSDGHPAASSVLTLVEELNAQHVSADWPRLAGVMWELAKLPQDLGWLSLVCAAFAALARASAGEAHRAREILGYVLPALDSSELLQPLATGLLGGAVWELGAADLAERLLPRALALADADRHGFYMTSTELTVARLSAVLGRFDALEYFGRARETLERREQWVLRAIVDYDEALARVTHRQPGAARLLAAARAQFERLGMHEWSRRAALLKVPDRELPDHLTAREAEILRLVAIRRTNKEIAAELFLSVHTVERHVQNAYRKIDARNRADAGDYVARVGL